MTAATATNLTVPGLYHGWMPTSDIRGTSDLLWGCLFTIFLSVWIAIHPPVPPYRKDRTKFSRSWRKWLRRKIVESKLVPALISLIIPEMMVLTAVSDFLNAQAIKEELKVISNEPFSMIHAFFLNMGGFCLRSPKGNFHQLNFLDFDGSRFANHFKTTSNPDDPNAMGETSILSYTEGRFHDLENFNELGDLGAANGYRASFDFDDANEPEEISVTSHAEGRFHFSENCNELGDFGATNESIASSDLGASGDILVASHIEDWIDGLMKFDEDDINAVAKADSLTKMITCFQALWFVTQVVSRLAEHRAVTLLEVSTCAYVFSAFITYAAWWKKPQNCSLPLMVDCSDEAIARIPESDYEVVEGTWGEYMWGGATWSLSFTRRRSMPYKFLLTYSYYGIPVFFGAIHVAAWNNTLPSQLELWMWRSSTLYCSVVSLLFLASDRLCHTSDSFWERKGQLFSDTLFITMVLLYIVVRLYTIFEVFFSMRALPHSAYNTVNWSAAVPHI